jgi:hypothetical protein
MVASDVNHMAVHRDLLSFVMVPSWSMFWQLWEGSVAPVGGSFHGLACSLYLKYEITAWLVEEAVG